MAEVFWQRGRTLGKGGFGFVSLASTSNFSDSLIAVKTCEFTSSQSLRDESEFLNMFRQSPTIIRCFGTQVTHEDGLVLNNLLLEYASGGSLADRLKQQRGGMAESDVRKHTKDVLLGLSQVHGCGIIHCDIKPHNLLLTHTDIVKIADFGLAMTMEQSNAKKHGLRGTMRYLAPESVSDGEYGTKVDIWALGCTVYELITGTPLWQESDDPDDVLYRIEFEDPNFQNPKMSRDAQDFVRMCLFKNPGSRWSADMLLNHPFIQLADNNVEPHSQYQESQLVEFRPILE